MASKEFVLDMARYNMWQNESLLTAANALSPLEREQNRGAFFGSIQKTLSHILWGDMIWMSRFTDRPAPAGNIHASPNFVKSWAQYQVDRPAFDQEILQWAHQVTPDWFEGELTFFSGAAGHEITKSKTTLVAHLFNHQTHHRGQVHAMLTAAGVTPDDTDMPLLPERFLVM